MFGDFFWPLLLIGGGVAILVSRAHRDTPVPPPPPPAMTLATTATTDSDVIVDQAAPDATETPAAPTQTAWQAPTPWPTSAPSWHSPGPPPPAPPAPRRRREPSILAPLTLSALLVFIGVVSFLDAANFISVDPAVVAAISLGAIGIALLVGAVFGRARGLILLGLVVTVACSFFATLDVPVRGGIGNRLYNPGTETAVRDQYRLGIGRLEVNLRHVPWSRGTTRTVKARLGIGLIVVDVPKNVALVLDGHAGAGEVDLTTRQVNDWAADDHVRLPAPEGAPVLHIDARVGIGQVQVYRPGDRGAVEVRP
jgi:hypothetical protein